MRAVFFLIVLFLTFSCKKDENKKSDIKKDKNIFIRKDLVFPDTIYLDSVYNGSIYYLNEFDRYTKKLNGEENISRFIEFNYTFSDSIYKDDNELENNTDVRSPAFNPHFIELKPIVSKTIGIKYLQGYIKDLVIFDTIKNIPDDQPLDGIEQKYFIRKKVIVLKK